MDETIARMTKSELKELIETSIEQKLLELLGDPDEGLPICAFASLCENQVSHRGTKTQRDKGPENPSVPSRLCVGIKFHTEAQRHKEIKARRTPLCLRVFV